VFLRREGWTVYAKRFGFSIFPWYRFPGRINLKLESVWTKTLGPVRSLSRSLKARKRYPVLLQFYFSWLDRADGGHTGTQRKQLDFIGLKW
jgi:hypothetical protein